MNHETVLRDFVEKTQKLVEQLAELDPAKLDRALKLQLEAFEAVKSVAAAGLLAPSPALAEAIEQGRRTSIETQRRLQEVHSEIEELRSTRARTSRHRSADAAAHFVSQRV